MIVRLSKNNSPHKTLSITFSSDIKVFSLPRNIDTLHSSICLRWWPRDRSWWVVSTNGGGNTLPETNTSLHLKMDGWTNFLGAFAECFRECIASIFYIFLLMVSFWIIPSNTRTVLARKSRTMLHRFDLPSDLHQLSTESQFIEMTVLVFTSFTGWPSFSPFHSQRIPVATGFW